MVRRDDGQLLLPLTDRNGRLVATLGAKSSLKRINRKQILDVDVSKACRTIVDPVVPLALRLQGNLL
jgi:meiotic recombination protein REC8